MATTAVAGTASSMAAGSAGAGAGAGAGSAAGSTTCSSPNSPSRHSAVVAGATGGVGRRVVHYLAQDPRVGSVTALTRRARDDAADLFDLSSAAHAAKVTFRVVDFDALADSGAGAEAVKVCLCQPRPAVIARACVFVCVCVYVVQCSPVQCSAGWTLICDALRLRGCAGTLYWRIMPWHLHKGRAG